MPIGVPMTTARTVRMRLPAIGLSSPPAEPGGGVISVNTANESPLNPCQSRAPRISTSHPSPNSVAASERAMAIWLRRRRAEYRRFMALSDPALDLQQHEAGGSQHNEGDDKQNEAERNQRGGVEVADRLGELVGDGRGDRRPRRQERSRYPVGVADDERHGHGLAQRPPQAQHDAADDADARIRQHDMADHLPCRASDPVGGLL